MKSAEILLFKAKSTFKLSQLSQKSQMLFQKNVGLLGRHFISFIGVNLELKDVLLKGLGGVGWGEGITVPSLYAGRVNQRS